MFGFKVASVRTPMVWLVPAAAPWILAEDAGGVAESCKRSRACARKVKLSSKCDLAHSDDVSGFVAHVELPKRCFGSSGL